MTPLDYVHALRLEEAKQMLETTDLPIDAVANDVGYEDASFFGRLFRRETSLTPGQYRLRFGSLRRTLQDKNGDMRRSGSTCRYVLLHSSIQHAAVSMSMCHSRWRSSVDGMTHPRLCERCRFGWPPVAWVRIWRILATEAICCGGALWIGSWLPSFRLMLSVSAA